MSDHTNRYVQWLHSFASLNWYEEMIKFIFNFVTKTSELLLAAGIVISTTNFLTGGDIMSHDKLLSDAWSWAQAIAIDSSLGIVFLNAFQAVREREKCKAIIFFTLTILLASVAGLITHMDAYSHASGLPITDKSVSGFIPLWVMTALRSIAVIGFLLASRLKNVSFNELRRELAQEPQEQPEQNAEPQREPTVPAIDYNALAMALITAIQQSGTSRCIKIEEEPIELPGSREKDHVSTLLLRDAAERDSSINVIDDKLKNAYEAINAEGSKITGELLSRRARVRKQTALIWLRKNKGS